jgi:hypothetical protein
MVGLIIFRLAATATTVALCLTDVSFLLDLLEAGLKLGANLGSPLWGGIGGHWLTAWRAVVEGVEDRREDAVHCSDASFVVLANQLRYASDLIVTDGLA